MDDQQQTDREDLYHHQKESKVQDEVVLPEELKSIIEDPEIPEIKKKKIIRALVGISVKSSSFTGPIPPPQLLKGYNDVVRDGAGRIIALAEKQSAHRIFLEEQTIREEMKQSRLGQVFGFILGLVGMSLATILALYDHETIAGIFGTTTIIGLVTVFVLGKKGQQKELALKNKASVS